MVNTRVLVAIQCENAAKGTVRYLIRPLIDVFPMNTNSLPPILSLVSCTCAAVLPKPALVLFVDRH